MLSTISTTRSLVVLSVQHLTTSVQGRRSPGCRVAVRKPEMREAASENDWDQQERIVRYVPVLSVFDITQTDPIAGASVPENPAQQLTGGDGYGVLSPLTAHLNDNGWTVVRQPLTRANGYTDPPSAPSSSAVDSRQSRQRKSSPRSRTHPTQGCANRSIAWAKGFRSSRALTSNRSWRAEFFIAWTFWLFAYRSPS